MTDKKISLLLDKGDVSKLEILKRRFMFSEDIDVIRYLLTEAIEHIALEIREMEQQQQNLQLKKCTNPAHSHSYCEHEEEQEQEQEQKQKVPVTAAYS